MSQEPGPGTILSGGERRVRVRFGPVKLGALAPGEWRSLTERELEILSALARAPRQGEHGAA